MRIILLVLLFVIWETWSPVATHWQPIDPNLGASLFFTGYGFLILIMRGWGSRLARGLNDTEMGRAVDRFNFGMAIARILIPAWFATGVFVLGWATLVRRALGPVTDFTPGTVLGLLPGFIAWSGLWWSQFPVDRALREQNVLFQLESDLPVFAAVDFRGYFINKLRVQLLFTVVPLILILILRDMAVLGIGAISHTSFGRHFGLRVPLSDSAESALSFGSVFVVLLFAPELLRHVLHTQKLPESPLRSSLAAICERSGVACREILLWRTQNNLGNAAVMGLIPRVRYVMLSDLLLESMTDQQIQAVFAHELGHVKHRHLAWFVVFFVAVSSCLYALASMLEKHLTLTEDWQQTYDVSSSILCGVLLIIGYGFLSRWFERQADVYAARTLGSIHPDEASAGIGAMVFASALERVAVVNNIPINARNWTHGSILSRMRYIRKLGRDPKVATQFDRTGRIVFVGLICLVLICVGVAMYGGVWK